jgi:hypothetical protein
VSGTLARFAAVRAPVAGILVAGIVIIVNRRVASFEHI